MKKRNRRRSSKFRGEAQPLSNVDSLDVGLEASDSSLSNTTSEESEKVPNETKTSSEGEDPEVMEYFILQSEYAFVARALSQMDGVGKGLDPEFDFISASAPYLVEVKGAGRYLVDEAKKKLKFVYDPDNGILAKEMALFKFLGFDPKKYRPSKKS